MNKSYWFRSLVFILSGALAFAPIQAYAQKTAKAAPIEFSYQPIGQTPTDLTTPRGDINYYRLMGSASTDAMSVIQTHSNAILNYVKSGQIHNFDELIKTSQGRLTLLRTLNAVSDNLKLTASSDFFTNFDRSVSQQVSNLKEYSAKHSLNWPDSEINQRARIQVLKAYTDQGIATYKNKILVNIYEGQSTLTKSKKVRIDFDIKNGFRKMQAADGLKTPAFHKGNKIYLQVDTPDGKVNHSIEIPSEKELKKIKYSDVVKQLKSGSVTFGLGALFIITVVFGLSYMNMLAQYEKNPDSFGQMLELFTNPLFYTSMIAFFAGSVYGSPVQTQLANLTRNVGRNAQLLANLVASKELYASNPIAKQKVVATTMFNMNITGFGIGSILQFATLHGGMISMKCLDLFNEGVPVWERKISEQEKQQLTQMCDQSFSEMFKNIQPELWKHLLSTMGGYAAISYLTSRKLKNANKISSINRFNSIKNMKGLKWIGKGPVPGILRFAGGLTGFMIASYLVYEALGVGINRFKFNRPLTNSKEDLQVAMDNLKDDQFKILEDRCDDEGNCKKDFYFNRFVNYMESSDAWRTHQMQKLYDATSNWTNHYGEMLNVYRGAKLFYSDISEQVFAKKVLKVGPEFETKNNSNFSYALISANGHLHNPTSSKSSYYDIIQKHADDPLPLYRSSPFFGMKRAYGQALNLGSVNYPLSTNYKDVLSLPGNKIIIESQRQQRLEYLSNDLVRKMNLEIHYAQGLLNDEQKK